MLSTVTVKWKGGEKNHIGKNGEREQDQLSKYNQLEEEDEASFATASRIFLPVSSLCWSSL